jgi:hypothetical protein
MAAARARAARRTLVGVAVAALVADAAIASVLVHRRTSTHLEPASWSVHAIEGREIVLSVGPVWCGAFGRAEAVETLTTVTVTAFARVRDSCPPPPRRGGRTWSSPDECGRVQLRQPLGARRLLHAPVPPQTRLVADDWAPPPPGTTVADGCPDP